VLLFYATQLQLIKPETTHSSATYAYIQPIGPKIIGVMGSILPFFKDMFTELLNFFDGVQEKPAIS
jgi:membrane protein required for colicin V production